MYREYRKTAIVNIPPRHCLWCAVVSIVALSGFPGLRCDASVYHSDGSAASVQGLANAALNGDTITLPAGTFTWTTGVTISKAIKIEGAGSGRIIGRSLTSVSVGTGSKTFTTQSGLSVSNGQTLKIESMPQNNGFNAGRGTWMQGSVTSYSGTTLVMNITRYLAAVEQ